jgi:hypothetical protein
LILIPKIAATRTAMGELGVSGSKVASVLGRGGMFVGAIGAAVIAVGSIDQAMGHTSINADAMTASLENLAKTGMINGEITKAFGANLESLSSTLDLAGKKGVSIFGLRFHGLGDTLTHTGSDFSDARDKVASVDSALTDLAKGDNPQLAAQAFSMIADAAKAQGVPMSKLASLLPNYAGALQLTAAQSGKAVDATTALNQAASHTGSSFDDATAAIKRYSDSLHALNDPLFAANQALQDLKDKQNAADKATRKYGAGSKQAKQANLELAQSALGVEAATQALAEGIKGGTVSLSAARSQLKGWVADGIITKKQADSITQSFKGLIVTAQGMHPKITLDDGGAKNELDILRQKIVTLPDGYVTIHTTTSDGKTTTGHAHMATGGPVVGPGTSTSDSVPIMASAGEWVVDAAAAAKYRPLLEMMRRGTLNLGGHGTYGSALASVFGTVSRAITPAVTDPHALAASLGATIQRAVQRRQEAEVAHRAVRDAKDHAKALADLAKAAQHEATVADNAAQKRSKDKSLQKQAHDADQAAKAAQHLADQAGKTASRAEAAYSKMASAAKASAQQAAAAAQSLVAEIQSETDALTASFNDFSSSISQGLTSGHGLSDVWQSLVDGGKATVTNLKGSLDTIVSNAQTFRTDLDRLAVEGASKDFISQLAGMGDAGKSLAEQLLAAGPGAIGHVASSLGSIQTIADSTGQDLATTFYHSGISSMEQYIKGLEKRFPELRKALHPLEHELGHMLGEHGAHAGRHVAIHSSHVRGGDGASAMGHAVLDRLDRIEHHLAGVGGHIKSAAHDHADRVQTHHRKRNR